MLELHTSRHQERLHGPAAQFYCTVCHCFRRMKVHRKPIPRTDFMTRTVRCELGHPPENVYVSTKQNINRFGKSGSY